MIVTHEHPVDWVDTDEPGLVQPSEVSGLVHVVTLEAGDLLQGPQGVKGDAGLTGPQGVKGDTGLDGPQGAKGDTGLTGPQGAKGDTGLTGAQGVKGDTGLTGAQGVKGDTGLTGPQGVKGDTGLDGPQGAKGDTGLTGPQGVKGDTGLTGPQGVKGDTGLTGPQGAKGDTGLAGAQGVKGDTGLTGAQGVKGDTGLAGAQGVKGDTGLTGAAGASGVVPRAGGFFTLSGDYSVPVLANVEKKIEMAASWVAGGLAVGGGFSPTEYGLYLVNAGAYFVCGPLGVGSYMDLLLGSDSWRATRRREFGVVGNSAVAAQISSMIWISPGQVLNLYVDSSVLGDVVYGGDVSFMSVERIR